MAWLVFQGINASGDAGLAVRRNEKRN